MHICKYLCLTVFISKNLMERAPIGIMIDELLDSMTLQT